MQMTITAAIHARWGHRVDDLIHTHAWTVEATVGGPADAPIIHPADDLEQMLCEIVSPWEHHYLTHQDLGPWKGFDPIVWDLEPTVEEIARRVWSSLEDKLPNLESVALMEGSEFDRCRTVRLSR